MGNSDHGTTHMRVNESEGNPNLAASGASAGPRRRGRQSVPLPRPPGAGCRVQGSGFRVQGAGYRVKRSGFGVQCSGFRVQGLGCRVQSAE